MVIAKREVMQLLDESNRERHEVSTKGRGIEVKGEGELHAKEGNNRKKHKTT